MFNFSSISYRSRLGRLLRLPLHLIPKNATVPILQGPMRGAKWITGSSNHGCWLGSYEMDKQLKFAAYLRPGYCVYDIGANVGFYTLLASKLSGTVYAFEPLSRNLDYLNRHLEINRIANVTVFPVAVGATAGTVHFQTHSNPSQGRVSNTGDVIVQQIGLDTFAEQADIRRPNVLKVDVEGAEYDVLRGGEKLLRECRPVIFLATHGEDIHRRCVDFLEMLDYRITALDSNELIAHRQEHTIP